MEDCFGNPPSQAEPTPRHFQLEKGLDKAKLNTLVDSFVGSRKILSDMLDLDTVANAKTSVALMQQLMLLAKVMKAESTLREQFINDLKKLGE
jgi:hypothetical protein